MTTTLTIKEVAARLDTTPREVRKFLRSEANDTACRPVGKGARYAIEAKAMRSLASKFKAWDATRAPAVNEAPDDTPEGD